MTAGFSSRGLLLASFVLIVLSLAPRWAFLDNPFIRDDFVLAAQNPCVVDQYPASRIFTDPGTYSSVAEFNDAFYRPLHVWTLTLDAGWYGISSRAFRRSNLLIHALTVVLFFFMTRRLLAVLQPESEARRRDRVALATAAVLAAHPLSAIATGYISNRSLVLATLFGVACVWSFLEERGLPGHIRTLLLLAAAMMSKESSATLPLVLFLITYLRPGDRPRPLVSRRVLSALVVVGFFVLLRIPLGLGQTQMEREVSLGERLDYLAEQSVLVLEVYLPGILWPRLVRWEPAFRSVTASSPAAWLAIALWVTLAGSLWRCRRSRPVLVLGVAATLLPMIPTFLVPQPIPAMFYRCFPGSGFLYLALLWALRRLWDHEGGRLVVAAGVVLLASTTSRMVAAESSEASMWDYALASGVSRRGLGSHAMSRVEAASRVQALDRLMTDSPADPRLHLARARALLLIGETARAERDLAHARSAPFGRDETARFLLDVTDRLQGRGPRRPGIWSFSPAYAAGFALRALREGNPRLARAIVDAAGLEGQDHWFSRLIAGEVSEAEGDLQAANRHYRSALTLGAPAADLKERIERVVTALEESDE